MAASTTRAAGTEPRTEPQQSEGQIITEIKANEFIWRPKILLALSVLQPHVLEAWSPFLKGMCRLVILIVTVDPTLEN